MSASADTREQNPGSVERAYLGRSIRFESRAGRPSSSISVSFACELFSFERALKEPPCGMTFDRELNQLGYEFANRQAGCLP